MTHTNNKEKYFFEINKTKYNFFLFDLKDKNGNIYLESGLYTQKTNCQKVIESVIRNSKNEDRFIFGQPYDKKWIAYLRNENGQIIAESANYLDTYVEAKNFIKNFKNLSLKTPVIDKTKIIIHSNKYESETFNPNSN